MARYLSLGHISLDHNNSAQTEELKARSRISYLRSELRQDNTTDKMSGGDIVIPDTTTSTTTSLIISSFH